MTPHPALVVERMVASAAAVDAASRVGLLDALATTPATAAQAADGLDLDVRLVERILDALAANGIATRDDARPARFGVPPSVVAAVPTARTRYAELPMALRGGSPSLSVDDADHAGRFYPQLTRILGEVFADAATDAADVLTRPDITVLDVGAGAAPWSLAIARRDATVRVVAVDLPAVVGTTRGAVESAGLSDQVQVVAADVLDDGPDDDLGGPFDLVLAANLCHLFAADRVAALLRRLAGHVAPDGHLAIVDVLRSRARGDAGLSLYALGLALRTSTGGLYDVCDYTRWLADAGLDAPEVHTIGPAEEAALLVSRPRTSRHRR